MIACYLVHVTGDHSVTEREMSWITRRVKAIFERDVSLQLEVTYETMPDKFPEFWGIDPESRFKRRMAWKEELKDRLEPIKIVCLPPFKTGTLYSMGGAADGICVEGMAMCNLLTGQKRKGARLVAHEVGHLLGAKHVSTPTIMHVAEGLLKFDPVNVAEIKECQETK